MNQQRRTFYFGKAPRRLLTIAALAVLFAPAAQAGSFSLFGAWTETDDLGDAAGGGLAVGIPLGDSGLDLDLRATYYEELTSNDFDTLIDDIFDGDDITRDDGIDMIPLEIGLRYNFFEEEVANLYVGGGAGYYLLDVNRGSIDDEFGWYVLLGAVFGDPEGVAFVIEGLYREVEGSVDSGTDPDSIDDIDDIDFGSRFDIDVGGPAVNAGVIWRF